MKRVRAWFGQAAELVARVKAIRRAKRAQDN